MRRFDVVPITSEFSENSNVVITSLCYVPLVGYIYAGTNLGDILLYKYEDFHATHRSEGDILGFKLNQERVIGRERCLRVKNISQKCKRIDKILPIISYDTVVGDDMESNVHIGGVILCICDGNLLYLDFRLRGKITLLCKGVSSVSIWKDSFNINTFQTKFCIATKKKIIFYNTCFLGDLLNIRDIIECDEEILSGAAFGDNKMSATQTRSSKAVSCNDTAKKDASSGKSYTSGMNSWFGFSNNSSSPASTDNKGNVGDDHSAEYLVADERAHKSDYLTNMEFIKVDEIQIPSRLASFTEAICNIEWCDHWVCFVIANTYFIMNIDDQSISDILNLDQLGSNFQPQIIILPEQEFMLTCQDNLGAFFNFNKLEPSPKSMIQWPSEGLNGIVLSSPYILGGTKSGVIQIYSLANYESNLSMKDDKTNSTGASSRSESEAQPMGNSNRGGSSNNCHNCVQKLQLDDEITCISTGGTYETVFFGSPSAVTAPLGPMVVVSTRTKIYALTPIPIEESIFELVNRGQGKQALNLLRTYCNSNDLLYNSLLYKTQCLVGWYEFKNLRFEAAFQSFRQAHIDPRVLIILFWKDLIPNEWESRGLNESESELYEYAKLPWTNSKGNLSEDLTPDVKFHESLLKSVLRKRSVGRLPSSIDSFIQSMLLNKSEFHSNMQIDIEGDLGRIDEYIYLANKSLKMFLLYERGSYSSNTEPFKGAQHDTKDSNETQLSYSTGGVMDIAIIKLIINECNSKHKRDQDVSLSNQIVLSLLNLDSESEEMKGVKESASSQQEGQITDKTLRSVFSEFRVDDYEDFLLNSGRYDILSILHAYNSSYLKSLEILENVINSSRRSDLEENSSYINIYLIIYKVLSHLCSSEITPIHIQANLLKRYSRFILEKFDICPIEELFTMKPVDKFPLTIDEILGLFSLLPEKASNRLTKSYLERIIVMESGNIEMKYKINLVEIYISDISMGDERYVDCSNGEVCSYANLFNDSFRPSKLAVMLEDLENFDTEILVKLIPSNDSFKFKVHDHIIVEYIIILFRSSRHIQALDFIVNVLGNIELAEIYTLAWIAHNKYSVQMDNKSIGGGRMDQQEFNLSFQDDRSGTLTKDGRQVYHQIKLFTEFKLWRSYLGECSSASAPQEEQGSGDLEISAWMDILDISQNEMSLISEEYCKGGDFNDQSSYRKLISKMTSLNGARSSKSIYSHGLMESNGELVALVKTLVDSWRSSIRDSKAKASAFQSSAIDILNKYSFHPDISIENILQIVPGEWPLLGMIDLLKNSLASSIHNQTSKSISNNLSAISYLRLYEKWSNFRSNHVTITQDMICHACSLKLGNKPCALYPNGSCVHTHCLSNDYYSSSSY
ncbi:hypothetical protein OIY81_3252 [Cryptosporidium canis]|nr:hypothetical protein OIY81_3252 [Cryptosporidium canis]